ncbi:hypothetical protein AAHA92_03392 [Salvia divinorum]|uniref:Uncharacterized protein n=1 Tax=Salvia divinorum TaxID=28513 RepID=A0ABD1IGZ3_SALDI
MLEIWGYTYLEIAMGGALPSRLIWACPLLRETSGHRHVSIAPGGRWNRFKTYSTIQRTLEIWGFVLGFIFKAWLSNQKFSYRGDAPSMCRRNDRGKEISGGRRHWRSGQRKIF